MIRSLLCFLGIALGCGMAFAQTAAKPLEFEVVAIKPSDPDARGSFLNIGAGDTFQRIMNTGVVREPHYLRVRYSRSAAGCGGPSWINTERYDVTAKTPKDDVTPGSDNPRNLTEAQNKVRIDRLRERVRTMLVQRFGFVMLVGRERQRRKRCTSGPLHKGGIKCGRSRLLFPASSRVCAAMAGGICSGSAQQMSIC